MDEPLPVPVAAPERDLPPISSPLIERWLEEPEKALEKLDHFVAVLERLRLLSIRATFASDWIVHRSTNAAGEVLREVGYLQDCGAERAGKLWGIQVEAPSMSREDHPDGSFSYHFVADAVSNVTHERVERAIGSRWSGDPFFTKQRGPDGKVDPTDVQKSALANLHGRVVRALTGLNGVPVDRLVAAGLDSRALVHVTYDKGAKGGESTGAAAGGAGVTVSFGRSKGKLVTELGDEELAWYLKAYQTNVADPERAKYRAANERVLGALQAEQDQRASRGTQQQAVPANRGARLSKEFARLLRATAEDRALLMEAVGFLTREWGAERKEFSALDDAQLDRLAAMTDEEIADLVTELKRE